MTLRIERGDGKSDSCRITIDVDRRDVDFVEYEQCLREIRAMQCPVVFVIEQIDNDGFVLFPLKDYLKRWPAVTVETRDRSSCARC